MSKIAEATVKVYAYGEPAEEVARLREICAQNNWIFKQLTGMGRPRGDYPIQKVLDAYRSSGGNVRVAAKALKLAPTTVLRLVRQEAAQKGDGAGDSSQNETCVMTNDQPRSSEGGRH